MVMLLVIPRICDKMLHYLFYVYGLHLIFVVFATWLEGKRHAGFNMWHLPCKASPVILVLPRWPILATTAQLIFLNYCNTYFQQNRQITSYTIMKDFIKLYRIHKI